MGAEEQETESEEERSIPVLEEVPAGSKFISPAFAMALVRMQGSVEGAKKTKLNPHLRNKYADLSACWDACREALQTNSIFVSQTPCVAPDGHIGLITRLVYGPTGEAMASQFFLPCKDTTSAQAAGSSITYARRYALCAAVGLCPEDDDGNSASGTVGKKTDRQPVALKAVPQTVDLEKYKLRFAEAKTNEDRKALYRSLKSAEVEEAVKTATLNEWAGVIKQNGC